MAAYERSRIVFTRLGAVDRAEIIKLMNHPKVRRHVRGSASAR